MDGQERPHEADGLGGRRPLRSLVLAASLPYPPIGGFDLRILQTALALHSLGPVAMVALAARGERPAHLDNVAFWGALPAVATGPLRRLAGKAWVLRPGGHHSDQLHSAARAAALARIAGEVRPDLVVVEGVNLHRFLPALMAPGRRLILNMHNVESELAADIAASLIRRRPLQAAQEFLAARRLAGIEDAFCRLADRTWVCSTRDAVALGARGVDPARIAVVPNALPEDPSGEPPQPPADRFDLVFCATFNYPPNQNAARWLIDELFPVVAARHADARLILLGRMPEPFMTQAAAREPRIVVTGQVPDVGSHLRRASAAVVPLFEGGGTRFKVLEAMAAGLPVISTAKGAEGLDVREGEHILFAETTAEFADAITRLRADAALRAGLIERGRTLVLERYSPTPLRAIVRADVERLFS